MNGGIPSIGSRPGTSDGCTNTTARAALQFVEDGIERRVAEVDAAVVGEQDDAVGAERVEGAVEFGERAVDVGQRQRREEAEPVRDGRATICAA